jgi:hypothetical protein
MTIKRGYHRMQTAEGRIIKGPIVVETTEKGKFLSYHPLCREEPNTEWLGGCFYNDN